MFGDWFALCSLRVDAQRERVSQIWGSGTMIQDIEEVILDAWRQPIKTLKWHPRWKPLRGWIFLLQSKDAQRTDSFSSRQGFAAASNEFPMIQS